jgi:hypothetical protein
VFVVKKSSIPVHIAEDSTTIHNEIIEPCNLTLATPESNLIGGRLTVFFVKMSDEFAKGSAVNSVLTTLDDVTGDPIGNYPLIAYTEVANYGVQVPAALIGTKFMFAIVDINDEYLNRTITLHSTITIKWGIYATSETQMNAAFSVVEF